MFSCEYPGLISSLKSCSTGMIDILFNVSLGRKCSLSFRVFVFDIYGLKLHFVDSCC